MENQPKYLCTFKFYDSKKRRLTICAREADGTLKITVLTLSETPEVRQKEVVRKNALKRLKSVSVETDFIYDTFSKKKGRKLYEEQCLLPECEDCPGQSFEVKVEEGKTVHATFFEWCNSRYYRQAKVKVEVEKLSYVRGSKWVNPNPKKKKAGEEVVENEQREDRATTGG